MVNPPMELSDGLLMMSWTYRGGIGTQNSPDYDLHVQRLRVSNLQSVISTQVTWMSYLTMLHLQATSTRTSINQNVL